MCRLLIDEFCKYFACEIKDLQKILSSSENRAKVELKFNNVWLRTTYKNRNGIKHRFKYGGLSTQDVRHTKAYNNFLGVTVLQHFYARHRIYVHHHNLPCVLENTLQGDTHYYPLELLEVYTEQGARTINNLNDDEISHKINDNTVSPLTYFVTYYPFPMHDYCM